MKKSDMLKAQLNALLKEAEALANDDKVTVEQIQAKESEIKNLQARIELQIKIENEQRAGFENQMQTGTAENATATAGAGTVDNAETEKEAYKQAFFAAVMGKNVTAEQREILIKNALSSTTGEDGGYLIPVDQQVAVKELMREFKSLDELVNIETVSTLTGSRNIEKDAEFTPFANLTEGNSIADTDTPQFVNLTYSIKDYAGIMPVPNNLLADAKGLEAHLMKWLARKNVATRNSIITALLATLTKSAVTGIDSVKTILNVTLDPAIADKSYIIMNQDSFNKFDQMKDNDNRPLLQVSPTDQTKKLIAGKEIKVYSNKTLATRTGTGADAGKKFAPVIIGNLKEVVTIFDRQAMSLLATNIGAGAFEKNQTKYRAILRLDGKTVDTKAAIFGEIEVTA